MEKNTKILAVIVVIIIIIAGCGAAAFIASDDDDDDTFTTDSVAQVYGNANMDFTIDSKDVDMIQDIVDGKTTWNSTTNPFADTNADGKITQDDVDLAKKIINKESCTLYYYDYWGNASALNYPITDPRICVTYWQQGEEMGILGLWDKIVVANASVFSSSSTSIYDHTGITSVGTSGSSSSTVNDASQETIVDKKCNLIIASCYTSIKTACDNLATQGIQSIFLWHAGSYCLSTILTLGVILDKQDNAQKYVGYCDNVINTIQNKLKNTELVDTIILMMYENEANYYNSNSGITTYVNQPEGAWYLLGKISNVFTDTPTNTSLGRSFYSMEWYIENGSKYDYIIDIEESTGLDGTQEKYNSRFETNTSTYLSKTDAYQDGKVIGTTYTFGGFAGYSSMMLVAWMLYPTIFTEEEGLNSMQEYYDEFTNANIDVHDRACYYTGTAYSPLYLRN